MSVAKNTSLLILAECAPECSFGVGVQTEVKIWCVKGVHLLKLVSSEKKIGFKGLIEFNCVHLCISLHEGVYSEELSDDMYVHGGPVQYER